MQAYKASKCKCGGTKLKDAKMCRSCWQKQQAADVSRVATRLAEGRESAEDRLRRELLETRTANRRMHSAFRQISQHVAFEDRVLAEIREFVEKNPFKPMLKPVPRPEGGKASEHQMLALVSDAHYPEVVDPEATFGLKYGPDIAERRILKLRDAIVRYRDLRATSYPTTKLTVAVIGDMLSGDIHEELEVTNAAPMTTALVDLSYLLYDMGRSLTEAFPEVEMIVMPGNHPRKTKKPRFKQRWNNWEYLMGRFIQALARGDERLSVVCPKDIVYRHQIFGFNIGLSHGDGVKAASFAGIPWYAMKQRRDAYQALMKSVGAAGLDLLCYGHFHQLIFEEGMGCSLVINGSIKGGDEFSVGTRYASQTPVQALLTFHPRHGITDLSRINLGHIQ